MSYNYNPSSKKAEEFINHEEILETLSYAEKNKNNVELIDRILAKARLRKGLSHREAAVLLDCEIPEKVEEIFELARQIKQDFYGNRIVMFAPLYLSNYCVNGCVYCPYHAKNRHITRKKLTQEEVAREVIALQDMGHKRLAIEAGEDPVNNPIEYILECINTIYSIKHKNGAIRRVNVNIAATTVENYRKLKDAGIGTYILFQETYHKQSYLKLHPAGPKHDYDYHTEAMDRAMDGGIDDVGLGVLFGLEMYKYEFAGLLIPPPSGDSFPSNHSMVSFAAAAALCCLPGKGRGVLALKVSAVAVACLIAFSRLYLYVHYPSDILAGAHRHRGRHRFGLARGEDLARIVVRLKALPKRPLPSRASRPTPACARVSSPERASSARRPCRRAP